MRLRILIAVAAGEPATFTELKRLLRASDGNLSVHARRLEDAGYLACSKSFEGRIPRTEYRLTTAGWNALKRYLHQMELVIRAVQNAPAD